MFFPFLDFFFLKTFGRLQIFAGLLIRALDPCSFPVLEACCWAAAVVVVAVRGGSWLGRSARLVRFVFCVRRRRSLGLFLSTLAAAPHHRCKRRGEPRAETCPRITQAGGWKTKGSGRREGERRGRDRIGSGQRERERQACEGQAVRTATGELKLDRNQST